MAERSQRKTVKSYLQKHKSTGDKGPTSIQQTLHKKSEKIVPNEISDSIRQKEHKSSSKTCNTNQRKETKASYMRRKAVAIKLQIGSCNIDYLPDEILLIIFGYLDPNNLLSCARVCKRWLYLAKDNLLWENIYKCFTKKDKRSTNSVKNVNFGPSYWKSICIKQCKETRDKLVLPMLKKISPFTGLCANTEKALQKSGVRWMLCFEDNDGIDHMICNSDVFYFTMSVCVRWYALVTPPLYKIKKVKIYSGNPIFFDKKGKAAPNSPCQRSLLFEMDFRWSEWKTSKEPQGGDEMIDVHIVPSGLLVASFKDGKDIAFITANFHSDQLVRRCLMGTGDKIYITPRHRPVLDDIDPKYGLHDYTCTIELRNQRTSFWSQQFRNLYTKEGDIIDGHARLVLIDPENDYDRSSVAKKISFLWKTDIFKGCVENLCFMDMTLLDERSCPMWCVSSAVSLTKPSDTGISYTFDGDYSVIEFKDPHGRIVMKLVWEMEERQYFMVGLEMFISLSHINQWFGTRY